MKKQLTSLQWEYITMYVAWDQVHWLWKVCLHHPRWYWILLVSSWDDCNKQWCRLSRVFQQKWLVACEYGFAQVAKPETENFTCPSLHCFLWANHRERCVKNDTPYSLHSQQSCAILWPRWFITVSSNPGMRQQDRDYLAFWVGDHFCIKKGALQNNNQESHPTQLF